MFCHPYYQGGGDEDYELIFLDKNKIDLYCPRQSKPTNIIPQEYTDIFEKHFSNGFNEESFIDIKRLKNHLSNPNISDRDLIYNIRPITARVGDKRYLPDTVLDKQLREDILEYIETFFDSEPEYPFMYYSVIYEKFSDRFQYTIIHNEDELRQYLYFYLKAKYYTYKKKKNSYFSNKPYWPLDINNIVAYYILNKKRVVCLDELIKDFPQFPKAELKKAFTSNALHKEAIISDENNKRFHISILNIEPFVLDQIKRRLLHELNLKQYLNFQEIEDIIKNEFDYIYKKYKPFGITPTGIGKIALLQLEKYFSVNGSTISLKSQGISRKDVYKDFFDTHDRFSFEDFQKVLTPTHHGMDNRIIAKHLYPNCVRINQTEFINSELINFDIQKIDSLILSFLNGDSYYRKAVEYLKTTKIDDFTQFPSCGYQWNKYLLESYLFSYSKELKIYYSALSCKDVLSIIVKKDTRFNNLNDILIDIIAKSDIKLTKDNVLSYLIGNGYILTQKSLTSQDLEDIIYKARLQRN